LRRLVQSEDARNPLVEPFEAARRAELDRLAARQWQLQIVDLHAGMAHRDDGHALHPGRAELELHPRPLNRGLAAQHDDGFGLVHGPLHLAQPVLSGADAADFGRGEEFDQTQEILLHRLLQQRSDVTLFRDMADKEPGRAL
jgi:hypothetical protein